MNDKKVYRVQLFDAQGAYVKLMYEHQAQAEVHGARMGSDTIYTKILLDSLKSQGFVEQPYSGCEGFMRTCKNPVNGRNYCPSCLSNLKAHWFSGSGSCDDCAYGGCAQPMSFPCRAYEKAHK